MLQYRIPVAKVMVNLAPAGTRKSGSVHDIAILVAVLKAAGYIKENLDPVASSENFH